MKMEDRRKSFEQCTHAHQAAELVRKYGVCHPVYCHYTTLGSALKMLQSGYMFLRRCDSLRFDDLIEGRKYGDDCAKKRFYLSCFSHLPAENAAMWGLYCPPTYQALRIDIPQKAMKKWAEILESRRKGVARRVIERKMGATSKIGTPALVRSGGLCDVMYASVEIQNDEDKRSRTLAWNSAHTGRIAELVHSKKCKGVTGLLKDYEWRFESESRLYVRTKESYRVDQLAVSIPKFVINSMKFVLSPWADKDEVRLVKRKLTEVYERLGMDRSPSCKESVLSGALVNWAKRRGM